MSLNQKAIEVIRLFHTYEGGVEALNGIDLVVEEGEILGVIGRNGSGKTTLVKHFNGLLKPSSGDVRVFGVSTKERKIAALAADVGYVFQNPDHQIFLSTVEEEISFGPDNVGIAPIERDKVAKGIMKSMGLWESRKKHPMELARLQRKLLSIASVLAMMPRVIVFDEPTTGQDIHHARVIQDLVNEFARAGHTLVIISHDMSLVAETCKRVIVMNQGKILDDGNPAEVFSNPEILERAGVEAPDITQIASRAGLSDVILDVRGLVDSIKRDLLRAS